MNIKLTINFIYLFVTLLYSCEYLPKGENEVHLNPKTDVPPLDVELNFNSDTVFLPTNAYPKIRFTSPDSLVKSLKVYIDDKLYTSIESNKGEFSVNSSYYLQDKEYKLKLEFFASSGTGSMADQTGLEGFVYSKTWVLIFKHVIDPCIIKFTPMNSSLKLEWGRYKGIGFKKYIIGHCNGFGGILQDTIAEISDINTTFCFDNTFVGPLKNYAIFTYTQDETLRGFSSFSDLSGKVLVSSDIDGNFIITWPKNIYFNNLCGYRIYSSEGGYNRGVEIATILDPNANSYTFKGGAFATFHVFYVTPLAKKYPEIITNQDQISHISIISNECSRGLSLSDRKGIKCSTYSNYFFCSDYNYIYKCNTTPFTFQKILSTNGNYSLSPDGNLLISERNGQFNVFDTNNTNLLTSDSVKNIIDVNRDLGTYFISNNGIGLIPFYDFHVYDFIHKKQTAKFKITEAEVLGSFNDFYRISPNGDFCLIRYYKDRYITPVTSLFKIENDTARIIWAKDTPFAEFDPVNPNIIYYYSGTKFCTMSLSSLTVLKELDLDAQMISSVDYLNKELLGISKDNDKVFIYDLNSGVKKYELPIHKTSYYIFNFKLKNKHIFNGQETVMKLDY